jgi:hypothetical protein
MSTTHRSPQRTSTLVRPGTLTAAVWGGGLVGLLYLAGAIAILVQGKSSVEAYLEKTVGSELADLVSATPEIEQAYQALVVKANVAIGFGLVILLFAVLARNAGAGARIGLAVVLTLSLLGGSGLQIAEYEVLPSASVAVAMVAPLLSLVTIILLFLPATNRFAAARKHAR